MGWRIVKQYVADMSVELLKIETILYLYAELHTISLIPQLRHCFYVEMKPSEEIQ